MATINSVIVEGNLVRAAELSRWGDGTPYCRFTVASNESYKDQNGQWQDIPSFIDCLCKGPYAESMAKHLLKGRRITVQGRLKQQRWTDDAGNKKSAIVVKVSEISLAPFGNNNFRPSQEQQAPSDYVDTQPETYSDDMFDGSEEIPF